VTNGFHTRRARMLFRHELGDRMDRVHFVAAPTDGFSEDNWWRSGGGCSCYATEYFKLVYYGLTEDRFWQGTVETIVGLMVALGVIRRLRRRKTSEKPWESIVSRTDVGSVSFPFEGERTQRLTVLPDGVKQGTNTIPRTVHVQTSRWRGDAEVVTPFAFRPNP
jgi:hypothetical protein